MKTTLSDFENKIYNLVIQSKSNSKWAHSTSDHLPPGKKSNDIEIIGNIYEHNQTLK